jgi:hypothetical protein
VKLVLFLLCLRFFCYFFLGKNTPCICRSVLVYYISHMVGCINPRIDCMFNGWAPYFYSVLVYTVVDEEWS